eukprot:gene35009-42396_t
MTDVVGMASVMTITIAGATMVSPGRTALIALARKVTPGQTSLWQLIRLTP